MERMDNKDDVDRRDWLVERFEVERPHLRAVAHRMLGSLAEADDAVQESWLRLSRSETSDIANLGAWLTTVVGRVCLDMLRARRAKREEPLDVEAPLPRASREGGINPEREALLADDVGLALLVVLDTLNPAERLAFVLHDLFDVPFEEIAPIVERSPDASRQLASRARRRVRGATTARDHDVAFQREVVGAFLAASRGGNFAALLALLDPRVLFRADGTAIAGGVPAELRGARVVAGHFARRARGAQPALVNGAAGAVWAPNRQPRGAFLFTLRQGRVAAIEVIGDPVRVSQFDIVILDA
ncbi:MAG TPA: sigma-70 family RNA polymerase sigma factor [Ktedonobacterales bacterium]|nr:sigma-70 family RNA polymerase sigma factor [Ktedonobacterales bacterium]